MSEMQDIRSEDHQGMWGMTHEAIAEVTPEIDAWLDADTGADIVRETTLPVIGHAALADVVTQFQEEAKMLVAHVAVRIAAGEPALDALQAGGVVAFAGALRDVQRAHATGVTPRRPMTQAEQDAAAYQQYVATEREGWGRFYGRDDAQARVPSQTYRERLRESQTKTQGRQQGYSHGH